MVNNDSSSSNISLALWVGGARPRTLPLGLAPVLIGAATSWRWGALGGMRPCPASAGRMVEKWDGASADTLTHCAFSWPWFAVAVVLCIVVAVGLQIAVNYLNDYADGVRGTDVGRDGEVTGPRRLVASGANPRQVLLAAGIAAMIACAAGLAVIGITGRWWMIALGAVCLLAAWGYTNGRHPYGYRGLGELAAFIFFGLVPALGTQYVLSGSITVTGAAGSVICGLLSVGVMMVNNLRDLNDDAAHGKRTLMVRVGEETGKCWHARVMRWAEVLTVIFAMPVPVYVALLGWLVAVPAQVDAECACVEYGVDCGGGMWGVAGWAGLAAVICIACCIVLTSRAIAAVRRDQWRQALPLCSMTALVVACAFVLNAWQASFI